MESEATVEGVLVQALFALQQLERALEDQPIAGLVYATSRLLGEVLDVITETNESEEDN